MKPRALEAKPSFRPGLREPDVREPGERTGARAKAGTRAVRTRVPTSMEALCVPHGPWFVLQCSACNHCQWNCHETCYGRFSECLLKAMRPLYMAAGRPSMHTVLQIFIGQVRTGAALCDGLHHEAFLSELLFKVTSTRCSSTSSSICSHCMQLPCSRAGYIASDGRLCIVANLEAGSHDQAVLWISARPELVKRGSWHWLRGQAVKFRVSQDLIRLNMLFGPYGRSFSGKDYLASVLLTSVVQGRVCPK